MRVDDDVLAVLSRAETNGNTLILSGQLDRKMYERTNKILEAAGGKWNRKAKAHVFDDEAANRIDQIILSGEVEIPKDEFNYFPSPIIVVDRLMELAGINPGMCVLEPSAGRGAISRACSNSGAVVDCYELMRENYEALAALNIPRTACIHADFLTIQPHPHYDRVVMNPPFAKQQDVKHVLHALKFLQHDGLLVSVMSAGVSFRDNKLTQEFRAMIEDRGGNIEQLPDGAFKESGTMVRTVIVKIPA